MTQRSSSLFWMLSSCAFLLVAACGTLIEAKDAVAEKTTDLKDQTQERARTLVERGERWLNQEPMEQREEACQEEGGEWVALVKASTCEAGVMTLWFDGEEQEQACDGDEGGLGGEADYQCLHRDAQGLAYFNDGPSVPNVLQRLSGTIANRADFLAYNRLFWPAGVNHDYCYHHGAITYGFDKQTCDEQYFRDLSAVCAVPEYESLSWFDSNICRKVAVGHYSALRSAGLDAYNVQNTKVEYPPYEPLWKSFGLNEDPTNEDAMADVDDPMRRVKFR